MELHGARSLLYVMSEMGSPQQTQNSEEKKEKKRTFSSHDVISLGRLMSLSFVAMIDVL